MKLTRTQEQRYFEVLHWQFLRRHSGSPSPSAAEFAWRDSMRQVRRENELGRRFGTNRKGRKARRMWEKKCGLTPTGEPAESATKEPPPPSEHKEKEATP